MTHSANIQEVCDRRYWIVHIEHSHTLADLLELILRLHLRRPSREEFGEFVKAEKRGTVFRTVLDDDTLFMGLHSGFGCGSDENLLIIMPARVRACWGDTHWVFVDG
ncbi:MAG: hypothetical protein KIH62_002705 [Candidatus Kerfeldbacteria bacterium]|nr:hypothetical protein [Candidatus Kerfeldbacteria bacterium]